MSPPNHFLWSQICCHAHTTQAEIDATGPEVPANNVPATEQGVNPPLTEIFEKNCHFKNIVKDEK